jgi:hypothetical protein
MVSKTAVVIPPPYHGQTQGLLRYQMAEGRFDIF